MRTLFALISLGVVTSLVLQLPLASPLAFGDVGVYSSCTNNLAQAENSRLSVKVSGDNYYGKPPFNSTLALSNNITAHNNNIDTGTNNDGRQNFVSMQVRFSYKLSNETMKPAMFSIVITAKNANQIVLGETFLSHTGTLVLKMEPAATQQERMKNKTQATATIFIPDQKIPSNGLRYPDENDTILVKDSRLFERGETYVADVSLVGMQSFFCSTEPLLDEKTSWTVVNNGSIVVVPEFPAGALLLPIALGISAVALLDRRWRT